MDPRTSEVYMYTQLKISRVLGIWPYTEQTMLWKKILSKTVFYSMLGIKFCTLLAVSYHIFLKWGHLPDPYETIVVLTAHFNTIFGMLYIPIRISKFLLLLKTMDDHFIIPTDSTQQHLFEETMRSASFVTKMFLGSALSTGVSYAVIPFTAYTNGTMNHPLPFHAALPFDITQTSSYWMAYFLLEISMFTLCINGSVNCDFFVSMIIKTTCQFRFLQCMIADIKEEATKRNKQKQQDKSKKARYTDGTQSEISILSLTDTNKDDEVTIEEDDKTHGEELDCEFLQRLSEYVKYHQLLLQFVHDLKTEASPFMLFQVLIYVIFLCMNVLGMSTVPVLSSEFANTLIFVICVLSLLLLLCWYGNELTIQSLEVAQAAYECDWCDGSSSAKRSLVMIMSRAQKPVKLTAWKFFDVDLKMFTAVLRATYSYYQVLHEVYTE